jgi:hypothetical protein
MMSHSYAANHGQHQTKPSLRLLRRPDGSNLNEVLKVASLTNLNGADGLTDQQRSRVEIEGHSSFRMGDVTSKMDLMDYPGEIVKALCALDVGCGVFYGVFCTVCFGARRMLREGLLPFIFLLSAMHCQRRGWYWGYTILHSVWHWLSASLMFEFLLLSSFRAA